METNEEAQKCKLVVELSRNREEKKKDGGILVVELLS